MTRDEAIAYLMAHGNLDVPCSRYGADTADCAPVAVDLAETIADATGEPMTTDALDHAMGLVVNDHDDVDYTLRAHGSQEVRDRIDWDASIDEADIEAAVDAYVACALWAGTSPDNGTPLDRDFTAADIEEDALQEVRDDVRAFIESESNDVWRYLQQRSAADLGHDFYLTRNRHGAGFWDGRVSDDALGRRLTDAAHAYGTSELAPADDGRLYLHG